MNDQIVPVDVGGSPYAQVAADELAAYDAFAAVYERQRPRPVYYFDFPQPEPPQPRTGDRVAIVGIVVMLIAAMVVSGSRTIYEFSGATDDRPIEAGGLVVGVAAFLMLEIGATAIAIARISTNYNKGSHATLQGWMVGGVIAAALVLIAGNLDATLTRAGVPIPEFIDTIIQIVIAVSAPLLTIVGGEVLGMYVARSKIETDRAATEHRDALLTWEAQRQAAVREHRDDEAAWSDALNEAWARQKATYGFNARAKQARLGVSAVLSEQTDRQTGGQPREMSAPSGFTRTAGGQQRVIDWLDAHPEDAGLSVRPLAEKVGVGHDTAAKGKKAWMAQRVRRHHAMAAEQPWGEQP